MRFNLIFMTSIMKRENDFFFFFKVAPAFIIVVVRVDDIAHCIYWFIMYLLQSDVEKDLNLKVSINVYRSLDLSTNQLGGLYR